MSNCSTTTHCMVYTTWTSHRLLQSYLIQSHLKSQLDWTIPISNNTLSFSPVLLTSILPHDMSDHHLGCITDNCISQATDTTSEDQWSLLVYQCLGVQQIILHSIAQHCLKSKHNPVSYCIIICTLCYIILSYTSYHPLCNSTTHSS